MSVLFYIIYTVYGPSKYKMTTTYFFDILMPANPIFKIFEPGLHLCASTKQPFVAAIGIGNPVINNAVHILVL